MKKTILRVAILVMMFIMLLSLVACSVTQDYKKARRNLRDNDYTVRVLDRQDLGVSYADSVTLYKFTDCIYINNDTAKEIYEITHDVRQDLANIERDLDKLIEAYDEDDENILFALYFEDSKTAREYFNLIEDIFVIGKREGLKAFDKIKKADLTYGVTGVVVYFGTKDAVKASR